MKKKKKEKEKNIVVLQIKSSDFGLDSCKLQPTETLNCLKRGKK